MLDVIVTRLAGWGYEATEADQVIIQLLIDKTDQYIMNYCNVASVPDELEEAEIDMIAIEFLKQAAISGGLDTTGLRVDGISSITEGDASVSYASSGSVLNLSALYGAIKQSFDAELLPFRKLRW